MNQETIDSLKEMYRSLIKEMLENNTPVLLGKRSGYKEIMIAVGIPEYELDEIEDQEC